LHLVARMTNGKQQHHRSWGEGDGHLGESLRTGRDFYVNYHDDPREDLNTQERPTDKEYFGCRISALIRAADGRKFGVHGAICITSSNPDRLSKSQVGLVANLAQPLSALFYAREIIFRRVRDDAQARNPDR